MAITTALTPRRPASISSLGTLGVGVAMIASSGALGKSARRRYAGRLPMCRWRRLTQYSGPLKPPVASLRASSSPKEPGRSLAPINATEAGLNNTATGGWTSL